MNRREFIYGVNGGLGALAFHSMLRAEEVKAVSYTHLTLPTICSV